jgi:hypothetical protein
MFVILLLMMATLTPLVGAAPTIQSHSINLDDSYNLYTAKKYYNFTSVIANTPPSDISNVSIKFEKASTIVGFFKLLISTPIEKILNGNFSGVPDFVNWVTTGTPTIQYYNDPSTFLTYLTEDWESGSGAWTPVNGYALNVTNTQSHSPTHSVDQNPWGVTLGHWTTPLTADTAKYVRMTVWMYLDGNVYPISQYYRVKSTTDTLINLQISSNGVHPTWAYLDAFNFGGGSVAKILQTSGHWYNVTVLANLAGANAVTELYVDGVFIGRNIGGFGEPGTVLDTMDLYGARTGLGNILNDDLLVTATTSAGKTVADLKSTDSVKQQWGTSAVPSVGAIPFSEVQSWGFWASGDVGGVDHDWFVTYYVAHGVFNSLITYFPNGFGWTYFDVKATILAYDPTVATDPTASAVGIYFKSSSSATVHTYITDVSMLYRTLTWQNQSPTTWSLDTTNCKWSTNATSGIATFFVKSNWSVADDDNVDIATSATDTSFNNSTLTTTNYCNLVSRLVLYNYLGNATQVSISNWLKLSGNVRYALSDTSSSASSSYPPNVQFVSVKAQDQLGVNWATNTTITNGAFSLKFPLTSMSQTEDYYIFLTMVSPYVAGLTPDGRFWKVTLVTSAIDVISQAFAMFGLPNYLANLQAALLSFSAYFASALSFYVSAIVQIVSFIVFGAGVVIYWITTFIYIITYVITVANNLLHGVGYIAGTGLNWWTTFVTTDNMLFVAIFLFILWFDALSIRASRQGVSYLERMVGDAQMIIYLLGYVTSIAFALVSFIIDIITRFVQGIIARYVP